MREKASGSLPGGRPVLIGKHTVHPYCRDSFSCADRVAEGSSIPDRLRIEEHQVRVIAFADSSPARQSKSFGRHPGHFIYSLRKRKEPLFAAVITQHARKGTP
jgi:hypothetical protein